MNPPLPTHLPFVCPACHAPLEARGADGLCCSREGTEYCRVEGIWRMLLPGRLAAFQQFIHEYETVRQAEGRGSLDPAYYRALPFNDLSGRHAADWRIRGRSYRMLAHDVLTPWEATNQRALTTLDLGAGNGWLSYRLAQRGHNAAAVDLLTNPRDGLGAFTQYDARFTPVQAEFDHLPFADRGVDLVLYNASFHYSPNYAATLGEAMRVLHSDGRLVILDSPVYHSTDSGLAMVRERQTAFERQYGFASNAIPSQNFLTYRQLDELGDELGLRWQVLTPNYGLSWALRPWRERLALRREPANFHIIVGRLL